MSSKLLHCAARVAVLLIASGALLSSARICGLNLIAQAKAALGGDLDRLVRCVRLGGFVNSMPDFLEQPRD